MDGLTPAEFQPLIESSGPELDVHGLLARARVNLEARGSLPQTIAAHGQARLRDERDRLLQTLDDLHRRMDDLGRVETRHTGAKGKFDLWAKRLVRRLINRHLHQQRLVHEALTDTLHQLVRYLDFQDQALRACLDLLEHRLPHPADYQVTSCRVSVQEDGLAMRPTV